MARPCSCGSSLLLAVAALGVATAALEHSMPRAVQWTRLEPGTLRCTLEDAFAHVRWTQLELYREDQAARPFGRCEPAPDELGEFSCHDLGDWRSTLLNLRSDQQLQMSLRLASVWASDQGVYVCALSYADGRRARVSSQVTVISKPFALWMPSAPTWTRGQTGLIYCELSDIRKNTDWKYVAFFHNGSHSPIDSCAQTHRGVQCNFQNRPRHIVSNYQPPRSNFIKVSLHVRNVGPADAGTYLCKLEEKSGRITTLTRAVRVCPCPTATPAAATATPATTPAASTAATSAAAPTVRPATSATAAAGAAAWDGARVVAVVMPLSIVGGLAITMWWCCRRRRDHLVR